MSSNVGEGKRLRLGHRVIARLGLGRALSVDIDDQAADRVLVRDFWRGSSTRQGGQLVPFRAPIAGAACSSSLFTRAHPST